MTFADEVAKQAPDRDKLGRIAELLANSGIDLAEIGRIDKVRIGEYQMLTKNDDGEAEIHDLRADSLVLTPAWADGPAWPVVQPAKPCVVRPVTTGKAGNRSTKRTTSSSSWKTAAALPDVQCGYYRVPDGRLIPIHDEAAWSIVRQILRAEQPDRIVMHGDNLDLCEMGKYRSTPAWASTTQATIDRGARLAFELRADVPDAEIDWMEGNHELRLGTFILDNAKAAFGLKRADMPESWPVLSVPNLCRFDESGVTYHPGWPAAEVFLNDRLRVIHGHKHRSNGTTATAYLNDERVSTLYGHIHRREWAERTRHTRDGPRTILAASFGCLCRVDGAVPGTKTGYDLEGLPVTSWQDWQQGLGLIHYEEGDGRFQVEPVAIHPESDGAWARWGGREFSADRDMDEVLAA